MVTSRRASSPPPARWKPWRFSSSGDEWGAFGGRFTADEPGKHEVTLTCRQTEGTLQASFFVQGGTVERIGRAARPEVLEEIARVTGGKVIRPDRLDEIFPALAAVPEPAPACAACSCGVTRRSWAP